MSQYRDKPPDTESDTSSSESEKDDEGKAEAFIKFENRKEQEITSGGSYREVCNNFPGRRGILEVNHVIPKASYRRTPFERININLMPSIIMRYCDHRGLQSTAENSYREIQRDILREGNFFRALMIEIIVMWENHLLNEYEYDFEQMLRYCRDEILPNAPARDGVRNGRLISSDEFEELMKLYRDLREDPNPNPSRAMERLFERYLPMLEEETIQVFVVTLMGKTLVFNISVSATIEELKRMIEERCGVPVSQQILTNGVKNLDNNLTLRDYNITDKSTLHLLFRLRGGG